MGLRSTGSGTCYKAVQDIQNLRKPPSVDLRNSGRDPQKLATAALNTQNKMIWLVLALNGPFSGSYTPNLNY